LQRKSFFDLLQHREGKSKKIAAESPAAGNARMNKKSPTRDGLSVCLIRFIS